ncbi:hypothetical protein Tco_0819903 [Tanacetum coccineum]|uniref:Uncharacterized protein n=1 Tax=Tanacetum coccineum TaxID=301880 RepID=A0ABQ5ACL8_9ASTR
MSRKHLDHQSGKQHSVGLLSEWLNHLEFLDLLKMPTIPHPIPDQICFLGLEDVLSWLLVEGKHDAITVDINVIALFRQAIGSPPGRNDITAIGFGMHVGIVVDDEVLHKLESMVKKNELFEELMIVVVDTEQNLSEFYS